MAQKVRIALDAMGGDFGPAVVVPGADISLARHPDTEFVLFGDEAVIHILKSCVNGTQGVYKFVYGTPSTQRTVLRSATDLMLDAMREFDEGTRDMADKEAL